MKPLVLRSILLVLLTCLPAQFAVAQGTVQSKYNEGLRLYNSGKYGEALMIFEEVLTHKPDFVYARNYASKCKNMIAKGAGPKNDLEGKLARVIVPEISFSDAPIGDVLDYLAARASEISGGTTVVNFIYKGTPEQRQKTLITLSLRSVPMNEAIKYVGELSKSRIKYEEHAVIVDPNPANTPDPASGTGTTPTAPPNTVFGEPVKSVFD